MSNYFRITAYHPREDISVILDSNGMFEKLWQFSAFLVGKGFKIIEVGNSDNFIDSTFPLGEINTDKLWLQGAAKGQPKIQENTYQGKPCKAIAVYDKVYGQYMY